MTEECTGPGHTYKVPGTLGRPENVRNGPRWQELGSRDGQSGESGLNRYLLIFLF